MRQPSLLQYLSEAHPELEPSMALEARLQWADANVDEPEAQALVGQQPLLRRRLSQELMLRSREGDEELSDTFHHLPHPDEAPSGQFPEGPHGITMLEDLTAPPAVAEVARKILDEALAERAAREQQSTPEVAPKAAPESLSSGAIIAGVALAVLVVALVMVGASLAG